jgi:hypothetical protein
VTTRRLYRRATSKASAASRAETVAKFSAAVLGLISLLGFALSTLGFGVVLALNAMFGPDVLEVLRGPLDYLAMSTWVVVTVFNRMQAEITGPGGHALLLMAGLVLAVVVAVAGVALAYAHQHRAGLHHVANNTSAQARLGRRWVAARGWSWRVPAITASSVGSGVLLYLIVRAVPLLFALTLIPFAIGYRAAQSHFYSLVIEPSGCAKSQSAQARREQRQREEELKAAGNELAAEASASFLAVCVEVRTKELGAFRGRRVIATDESIALYDPASGAVSIVPRKDAVVTFIDKL